MAPLTACHWKVTARAATLAPDAGATKVKTACALDGEAKQKRLNVAAPAEIKPLLIGSSFRDFGSHGPEASHEAETDRYPKSTLVCNKKSAISVRTHPVSLDIYPFEWVVSGLTWRSRCDRQLLLIAWESGMREDPRRNRTVMVAALSLPLWAVTVTAIAQPTADLAERITGYAGGFSQSIPIEVPPFHGLEPRLTLGYSSYGRNGFVGVGWGLAGFSVIERASPGRGTPRFDANDIYLLDGQDLIPCTVGSVSPGCATGGTHSTKVESYLRISWISASNTWSVWLKDGSKTTFSSVYTTASGTVVWGQTQRIDTHGNTVTYTWVSDNGDSYPETAVFGPYRVKLFRETRPDLLSGAAGSATSLRTMRYRLKSVLVESQNAAVRAHRLTYTQSAATAASLLTAVTQYGKDVVIDAAGVISGGTSLPAQTFAYQGGADSRHFTTWSTASAETPPGGVPGDPLVAGTGEDGALTVTSGQTVLVDGQATALAASAAAGASTLTVASAAGFSVGHEVLVIQTTGPSAGVFETRTISWIAGNTLTLSAVLANDFSASGSSKAQVIRVRHHTTVTVQSGGTLAASPWNGSTGGVVFFRATGAVTVASGGTLTVAGRGFAGGAGGAVSSVSNNGSNGGTAGSAAAVNQHCPVYPDIGQVGWCDSCDYPPCQAIYAYGGGAAQTGSGSAVAAGYQGRGCNSPNWCHGGDGGAGGNGGLAGATANAGSVGLGAGAGAAGSGGANLGNGTVMLFGGSGGGGNGGAQGGGAGGGGGGGGGVQRTDSPAGAAGTGGSAGGKGGAGGAGGLSGGIIVVTAQSIAVQGTVSAAGAAGAAGTAGLAGGAGGSGGAGGVGSQNGYGNASGAQGAGGKGATGGTGGNGGGGGAGGTIYFRASQINASSGSVVLSGGPGGAGASGGPGGAGGAGPQSLGPGSAGPAGQAGTQGAPGRYVSLIF